MPQNKKKKNLTTAINQPVRLDPSRLGFTPPPSTSGLPQLGGAPLSETNPWISQFRDFLGGMTGFVDPVFDEGEPSIGAGLGAVLGAGALPAGMFSRMGRAIGAIPGKQVHPNKIRGMMQGQFNPEEAKFTGLTSMLDEAGNNPVSMQQIKQHVESNPLQVGEKVLGGSQTDIVTELDDISDRLRTMQENFIKRGVNYNDTEYAQLWSRRSELQSKLKEPTHYDQYTLPGGTDYQERALTWDGPFQRPERELDPQNYNNPQNKNPNLPYNPGFQSHPDFDRGNMIAWTRENVHETPQGPFKMIEEIQSDWHQQGATAGYGDLTELPKGYTVTNEAAMNDPNVGGYPDWITRDEKGKMVGVPGWGNEQQAINNALKNLNAHRIADAPFKGSGWSDLALKRAIWDAADKDMAGVAWTPGAVQNQRWSKTQVADWLKFTPDDHYTGMPTLVGDGPRGPFRYIVSNEQPLERLVGKHVAKQLTANPKTQLDVAGLEVGEKGMNAFYDEKIPNSVQKLIKPFGGKVEPVGAVVPAYKNDDFAVRFAGQPGAPMNELYPTSKVESILGVKLTPEMKKLIKEKGFYALGPMFAAIMGERSNKQ